MRILLDTHAFLWFIWDNPQLSPLARSLIESSDNQPVLSIVSVWEIVIKTSLGKLVLAEPPCEFVEKQITLNGFQLLPIELRHLQSLQNLPFHHKDPFDRAIIGQSYAENIAILGADTDFDKYPIKRLW